MSGYLFSHFIGEQKDGEQIYFSVSKDGLHWTDLNQGNLMLRSELGTKGVRDPFLVRDSKSNTVYLIATDLRIEAGKGWEHAQFHGSKDLIVWETKDLIHWTEPRACRVGIKEAGCVWAPEAIYDEERQAFFVFFASMVKTEKDESAKQRIYGTYTKDFQTFSDTFCYIERDSHVIDTTIVKADAYYYRISKNESTKKLLLERSKSLQGQFEMIHSTTLDALYGVEGPEAYLLPDQKTWCLIADQFAVGKGYLPMLTTDLGTGNFEILSPEQYSFGITKKRHGGVMTITEEEYHRLTCYEQN